MKGTCTEMCPESELRLRRKERLLHRFEEGAYEPVKEYSRPAAGVSTPLPRDIRTPETLERTVEYLIKRIFCQENEPLNLVFDYVFDRLRAVRQDMVLQTLEDNSACRILAMIVRFHVVSGYLLADFPVSKFDPEINRSHLLECIKSLLLLQDENDVEDAVREEMGAIYILRNLSSPEPRVWAVNLPQNLRNSSLIKTSMKLGLFWRENNFVGYFRLLRTLPPLLQAAANSFSEQLVLTGLKVYSVAFSSANCKYPVKRLAELLTTHKSALENVLEKLKIACDPEHVKFQKTDVKNFSKLDPASFAVIRVDNVTRHTVMHVCN